MNWAGAKVCVLAIVMVVCLAGGLMAAEKAEMPWVVCEGGSGPGQGKHIVFVTGDEEYRSEESMPMLAKILAIHHGFKGTVLFAINKETGEIDPVTVDNIPGLEALDTADLMVMFLRFRELPDEQMKHIMDYTNSGKPIVSLRTATHPFFYKTRKDSPYAKWSWNNKEVGAGLKGTPNAMNRVWEPNPALTGGYGRQVFGETWVSHYGDHQKESTRGLIAEGMESHPIVRGVGEIWGPSDVYGLTTLHGDCESVIMGYVLTGMKPDDKVNENKKPLPVAWTKTYTGESGKTARIFTTTMGHAGDFMDEDFRRLMVNACYWALGMEDKIPAKSEVSIVGPYDPKPIGFGGHKKGLKPADHRMK